MEWNSPGHWRGYRRGGNWWIAPLVIFGLIILTHGWILILPVIALAAFVFVGFVLPRLAWHMNQGGWHSGDWSNWHEMRRQHLQEWGEKHKHHFDHWDGHSHWHPQDDAKPKRKNADDIEYV